MNFLVVLCKNERTTLEKKVGGGGGGRIAIKIYILLKYTAKNLVSVEAGSYSNILSYLFMKLLHHNHIYPLSINKGWSDIVKIYICRLPMATN